MGPRSVKALMSLALALTLASSVSADLVVVEPAGMPGSFEVVPMFGLWGQTNVTRIGSQLLVYSEAERALYCSAIAEYERTGVANVTLRERAAGNKVILLNRYAADGTELDWYCGSQGYDRYIFYPCMMLGDIVLQMANTVFFGVFVYDRPGPFDRTELPPNAKKAVFASYDDMSAVIFGRGEVNQCTKANVIYNKGVAVNQGLSRVLEPRNDTLLVNLSVTPSRYQRAWALPVVRIWFAGVFPAGFLSVAVLAAYFFRKRHALMRATQASGKSNNSSTMLFMIWVLGLNAGTSLVLAVVLSIDGYGATGGFPSSLRNFVRPLFLGVACASDILIAGLWNVIVASDSLGAAKQTTSAFQSVWAIRLAVFFVVVDVFSGFAGIIFVGGSMLVFIVIPILCKSASQPAVFPFTRARTDSCLHCPTRSRRHRGPPHRRCVPNALHAPCSKPASDLCGECSQVCRPRKRPSDQAVRPGSDSADSPPGRLR
jgi:hypothetical protein